eukprot:757963-Hanusia_phi.AAC.1
MEGGRARDSGREGGREGWGGREGGKGGKGREVIAFDRGSEAEPGGGTPPPCPLHESWRKGGVVRRGDSNRKSGYTP